jgi:hypothetical protein
MMRRKMDSGEIWMSKERNQEGKDEKEECSVATAMEVEVATQP